MKAQACARLAKLLPKLGALTDDRRLKALAEIDRVFVRDGVTWEHIAAALTPTGIAAAEVVKIVDAIMKRPELLAYSSAPDFLEKLRARATADGGTVHLSRAQNSWLFALLEKAEKAGAQYEPPPKQTDNVVRIDPRPINGQSVH